MNNDIYKNDHVYIAKKLRQARLDSNMGQVEVSRKMNRTQSYISKLESGQIKFTVLQIQEFARLYNKSLDYFIK